MCRLAPPFSFSIDSFPFLLVCDSRIIVHRGLTVTQTCLLFFSFKSCFKWPNDSPHSFVKESNLFHSHLLQASYLSHAHLTSQWLLSKLVSNMIQMEIKHISQPLLLKNEIFVACSFSSLIL